MGENITRTSNSTIITSQSTTVDHTNVTQGSSEGLDQACTLLFCNNVEIPVHLYNLCAEFYPNILHNVKRERHYLQQQVSVESKVTLSLLYSLIMITSICGNSLVVMTFIVNKHMRSVTNVFILSLAVSDLLISLTCIPMDMGIYLSQQWLFGQFGCKLMPCITSFFTACSSLTLCCIAFDRYYAIVHPLELKFLQTPQRAMFLQIIVCTISAASSIPYAMIYDTVELSACKVADEEIKYVCQAQHFENTRKVFNEWVSSFVLFFGPFTFISGMYAVICYKLWTQRPIGAGSQKTNDGRLRLKRKAIKMLIIVVLIFVVCWSPLLLFNVIAEINDLSPDMSSLMWRTCLQCLSLSSTCWNPIVYAFMNEKFRNAFKSLLTCRKRRVHPVLVRNNAMRMSTESRKTTTQLEPPATATLTGAPDTTDIKG